MVHPDRQSVEQAVLAHLSGTPLSQAAVEATLDPAGLLEAVEVYQAAGAAALTDRPDPHGWHQVRIAFPDWDTAEETALAHLRPWLSEAEETGTISAWWFVRKAPCWRLRCLPGAATGPSEAARRLGHTLDRLADRGQITGWRKNIYEPETYIFGGPAGMEAAHRIFHADSRGALGYLHQPAHGVGRREVSVLVLSALFRGAGQERSEQADIWHRIAAKRPLPTDTPVGRIEAMVPKLRHLLTLDTRPTSPLTNNGGALAPLSGWLAAVTDAGAHLAGLDREGQLHRGLRELLAHHALFHFNRLGLPPPAQAALAHAARESPSGP
jgi:thiopeptide-type bacteriocin biosynthesis protein